VGHLLSVVQLLVSALSMQQDECTLQMILWALCTKVLEDAPLMQGMAQVTISAIASNLAQQFSAAITWPPSVMLVALDVLAMIATRATAIDKGGSNTIPALVRQLAKFASTGLKWLHVRHPRSCCVFCVQSLDCVTRAVGLFPTVADWLESIECHEAGSHGCG